MSTTSGVSDTVLNFIRGGGKATITVNFWSILIFAIILTISGYTIIRYRFMTKYSRLPDGDLKELDDTASYLFEPRLVFDCDEEKGREVMDVNGALLGALNILGHVEKSVFNKLSTQVTIKEFQQHEEIPESFMMENLFVVTCGKISLYLEPQNTFDIRKINAPTLNGICHPPSRNDSNRSRYFLRKIGPGQFSESIMMVAWLLAGDVELPEAGELGLKACYENSGYSQDGPGHPGHPGPINPFYSCYAKFLQWGASGVSYTGARIRSVADSKVRIAVLKADNFNLITINHPNSAFRLIQSVIDRFRRLLFPVVYRYLGLHGEIYQVDKMITQSLGCLYLSSGIVTEEEAARLSDILREADNPHESDSEGNIHLYSPPSHPQKINQHLQAIKKAREALPSHTYMKVQIPHNNPLDTPVSIASDRYKESPNFTRKLLEKNGSFDLNNIVVRNNLVTHKISEENPSDRDSLLVQRVKKRIYESLLKHLSGRAVSSERSSNGDHYSHDLDYDSVEFKYYHNGDIIEKQGEKDVGLYLVISGLIEVSVKSEKILGSPYCQPTNRCDDMSECKDDMSDSSVSIHMSESMTDTDLVSIYRGDSIPPGDAERSKNDYIVEGEVSSYIVCAGAILCYLSSITGILSQSTLTAKTDVILAKIRRSQVSNIVDKYPGVFSHFIKRFVPLITPLMHHIDVSVRWRRIPMGHAIWKEGGELLGIYIVMYGRLRSITENKSCKDIGGKYSVLSEYGQGSSVGEMEIINNVRTCPFTLYAVRDSEVAFIPRELFNSVIVENSNIVTKIALIATSQKGDESIEQFGPETTNFNLYGSSTNPIKGSTECRTFALLPLDASVPINEFASELKNSLINTGATVASMNQGSFLKSLGVYSFRRYGRHKYSAFFESQEEINRVTLYVADSGVRSFWATQCIKRADTIFLIANINGDPAISEYERLLAETKVAARKELVLLHRDRNCAPESITRWLRKRGWIQAHHYVYMHSSIVKRFNGLDYSDSIYPDKNIDYHSVFRHHAKGEHIITTYSGVRSDFSRLARRILSSSIGFVLSGGGARGIAHVGILKAFEERGIPIDMIGGCSIGSFIGALYACENNIYRVYSRTKMFSTRMSTLWRKAMDITYPYLSLFTGHEFNRGIWKCFKNMLIEECWLPFFCVTSNLTNSKLEVHQTGYLWKYVRASMTIAGYLPPMCDKGNMLVDGGYINNMPCDIMRYLGAKTIIAIDVSSLIPREPANYGDSISGWWLLIVRSIPFLYKKVVERYGYIPSLTDVQTKLSFASNIRHIEHLKKSELYTILSPPVHKYGTLEFDKFNELYQIGYEYGKQVLKKWESDSLLEKLFGITDTDYVKETRVIKPRRASI